MKNRTLTFFTADVPPEKKTRPPWATKIDKPVLAGIILIHILGFMTFVLWHLGFVNWINAIVFGVLYCVMGLSVTGGLHRYFTHKSFKTKKKWVHNAIVISVFFPVQGTIKKWVLKHRAHHKFTEIVDVEPHTPENGFWWAHFLWNIYKDPEGKNWTVKVTDLEKDPFLCLMDRYFWLPQCILMTVLFSFGLFYKGFWTGMGFVCTDALAVTCVYHATWSINSVCHMKGWLIKLWGKLLGRRNFETADNSMDSWLVALFTFGEGYHNYHHENERHAHVGFFDLTYRIIKLGQALNLVSDVIESKNLHT